MKPNSYLFSPALGRGYWNMWGQKQVIWAIFFYQRNWQNGNFKNEFSIWLYFQIHFLFLKNKFKQTREWRQKFWYFRSASFYTGSIHLYWGHKVICFNAPHCFNMSFCILIDGPYYEKCIMRLRICFYMGWNSTFAGQGNIIYITFNILLLKLAKHLKTGGLKIHYSKRIRIYQSERDTKWLWAQG